MTRLTIRITFLLATVAILVTLNINIRNTSAEIAGRPQPVPTPPATQGPPPPWYDPQAVAEQTKKLQEEKETLGLAIIEIIKDATANAQAEDSVAKLALPKLPELEKALAAEKVTEGEIKDHDGRCHAGQLEPGPYQTCVTEHNTLWSKYQSQVEARKSIAREIIPLQQKLVAMEAKDKEYKAQWETARARIAEIEQQLAKLAEIKEALLPCKALLASCKSDNCPDGIKEGLSHCWSVFYDGAKAGLPQLPKDPPLPFVMTPNSGDSGGDSGVVDSRGVKKMTAAEREAELKKPRARSGVRGSAPPPPPPPPPTSSPTPAP